MTTIHRPLTPAKGIVIMIVARGKGFVVQEAVSRTQPPGEGWCMVGNRQGGGFIWHRRVVSGSMAGK